MPPPDGIAGATPFFVRKLCDHRFSGDEKAGDGGRTLKGCANHLCRIDDALGQHIAILAGLRVKAERIGVFLEDLADNDRSIFTGIEHDLARRPGQRLAHDFDAGLLIVVGRPQLGQYLAGTQQRHAATWKDAFLNGGTRRARRAR